MEYRPLTLEDAPAVHALIRRWEKYWKAPLVTPLDEIVDDLEAPHLDRESDTVGVWEDGDLVAYGWIWHRPSGDRMERAYAFGYVDPEHRGRGIGRRVFGWQVERATEILTAIDNSLPKYLRADEWDWIEESHRLYRRFGLEPVRYFTEMLRPLDTPVDVSPIDGVEIVAYDRSRDEEALEALNSSFADHWGSTPSDLASFQHRVDGQNVRVDLSFLAVAGEKVVGVVLNAHFPEDEDLLGRRDGWIESVGVEKTWRNKGIATALIQTSFNAFVAAGMTHAAIAVDTANPTGALGLYSGLGFEPTQRTITSEVEITPV